MRRPIIIVGAFGATLLAASLLWLLIAPGQLVKYPTDLNRTVVATGTATIYTDPANGTPAANPQQLPLTIQRQLKVIASTRDQATVQETSTEEVGTTDPVQVLQRYVIDRSTLRNVADPSAYAYTPANVTNRSPAYSINLPFDTAGGPYAIWKNETASAYTFRRTGKNVERDGLTLIPLSGSIANAPATPAFLKQLGVPSSLTVDQLAPLLKAAGLDPAALSAQVLPRLSAADRKAITAALSTPVPVKYFVSVDTRLLVEPKTGAIVSLDSIDEVLSATPDFSWLAGLASILAKPAHARDEAVQGVLTALKGMPTGPTRAMRLKYAQTPASVADTAAYTQDKIDGIAMVESWIPGVLGMLGVILLGASVVMHLGRSRTAA